MNMYDLEVALDAPELSDIMRAEHDGQTFAQMSRLAAALQWSGAAGGFPGALLGETTEQA